jgi:hypothetical protein
MTNREVAFREEVVSKIRQAEDKEFCDGHEIEQINCNLPEYAGKELENGQFVSYLKNRISKHIDFSENCHIFFPLALGRHLNHMQVFEACTLMMKEQPQSSFILYEDLPYGHKILDRFRRLRELSAFIDSYGFKNYLRPLSSTEITRKRRDIMIYESQHVYKGPSGVRIKRYFTRTSLCCHPQEGIWIRHGRETIGCENLIENSGYAQNLLRKFLQMFFV